MDGFFKAENGEICEYDEIRPRSLYRKPFYREDQKDLVDMEARKFLFYDNQDWASVKVVPEVENLVLVPTQPKKSTKLRTSTLGPVHEKLQDPRKFYCDRCPSVHKRKDELE